MDKKEIKMMLETQSSLEESLRKARQVSGYYVIRYFNLKETTDKRISELEEELKKAKSERCQCGGQSDR